MFAAEDGSALASVSESIRCIGADDGPGLLVILLLVSDLLFGFPWRQMMLSRPRVEFLPLRTVEFQTLEFVSARAAIICPTA